MLSLDQKYSRIKNRNGLFRLAAKTVLVFLLGFCSSVSFAAIEQVRVEHDNDDAEERISDGDMYRDSSDLEMSYDSYVGGLQIVGMRFMSVNVPAGATINNAYVQFETDETDSGTTNLVIYGEDSSSGSRFANNDGNISSRTKTTASVSWSPSAWGSVNGLHQTPDISTIIKEIVDRPDWSDGDDIVIIIEPGPGCTSSSCSRTAESHDGESGSAPLLVVDYSAGPPPLPPVSSLGGACGTDNLIVVEFSASVGAEALDLANYSINNGAAITSATAQSSTTVVLAVTGMVGNQSYTLTVEGTDYAVDFQGLMGHYFDQRDGGGTKVSQPTGLFTGGEYLRLDSQVNFSWNNATPTIFPSVSGNDERFSIRWVGYVVPDFTGSYEFRLYSDDGMRLSLSGTEIVNDWNVHAPRYSSASAAQALNGSQAYEIQIEHFEHTGRAYAQVEWRRDSGSWANIPAANLRSCAVLATAPIPVLEYRMDENSWNGTSLEVADSTGSGGDGTAVGGVSTISDGQVCRAGDFDGVNDYVNVGAGTLDDLRGTSSLSFWIRTTQTGDNTGWRAPGVTGVEQAGGSDDIFWGWLDSSGRIGISVANDFSSKSTVAINDGTYHHVVLTRDAVSGAYKIYIDGVLNQSGTIASGIIGNTFSSIGRIEDTGGTPAYFRGNLDEVKVFNSVLTDGEVAFVYAETRTCPTTGLLAHFSFEQSPWSGAGVTIEDDSGSGNTGISVGSVSDNASGYVCRGVDVPDNTNHSTIDAINSRQDINDLLGHEGTIMMWYRAEDAWSDGVDRTLIDATTRVIGNANDKYFYLSKRSNGRLRFALEDTADRDFAFETGNNSFAAGTWVHVAVTWDMPNDALQIFVDGALAASSSINSNGALGDLGDIYLGDNSSTYTVPPGRSAKGRLDEIRFYDDVLTATDITTIKDETHPCGTCALGSFSITQPAYSLACPSTKAPVVISAQCDDGSGTKTDYTGTVALTTNDNSNSRFYNAADSQITQYTFTGGDSGVATVYLFHLQETSSVLVTANDALESVSTTASTGTEVRSSGLLMTNPGNFACGGSSSLTLTAFGQTENGAGQACEVITGFSPSAATKVWFTAATNHATEAVNNSVAGLTVNGASVTGHTEAGATAVSIGFTNGVATIPVSYGNNVAKILDLQFKHDADPYDGTPASPLVAVPSGGAPVSFVVHPQSSYTGVTTANAGCEPGEEDVTCSRFVAAGEPFSQKISMVCSDGNDLNLIDNPDAKQFATSGTPIVLGQVDVAGGACNDAYHGGACLARDDSGEINGAPVTLTDQSYAEVGVINLTTSAYSYFGVNIPGYQSSAVGRFYPDDFNVTIAAADFAQSCGGFTYQGQSFVFNNAPTITITARNAQGLTTRNYEDSFWKLGGSLPQSCATYGFCYSDQVGGAAELTSPTASEAYGSTTDVDGEVGLTLHSGELFSYSKSVTALSPFDADVRLQIFINDGDASGSAELSHIGFNGDTINSGAGEDDFNDTNHQLLRFGRMVVTNAFGSELASSYSGGTGLVMPVSTEYWNGSAFVTNTADSCSAFNSANVAITTNNLVGGTPPVATGSGLLSLGQTDSLYWDLQGNDAGIGTLEVQYDAPSWLEFDWDGNGSNDDPQAELTFGRYRGHDRIIYWREQN